MTHRLAANDWVAFGVMREVGFCLRLAPEASEGIQSNGPPQAFETSERFERSRAAFISKCCQANGSEVLQNLPMLFVGVNRGHTPHM